MLNGYSNAFRTDREALRLWLEKQFTDRAPYDEIVNVASTQQGSLDRIEPGDPDNSYLLRKIQGGPGISGSRMPAGAGPLSQDLIDLLTSWIEAGAAND